MSGTLAQLNVSSGGMPKLPIPEALVTTKGVTGDNQRNKKVHGGTDRAICIYSEELYAVLQDFGVGVGPGDVGENFTTRGIDLQKLAKGDRLKVGDVCIIEITNVRVPCHQLKKWDIELPELIVGRSGWVAKVITEGVVRSGDKIEVMSK